MFCARCGQQIPDATEICPLCGREATVQLQPPPALASAAPAAAMATLRVVDGREVVGGWLLFYCVVLTALSPLLMTSQLVAIGPKVSRGYILDVLRVVFGIVVGIFLWSRRAHAFTLLKIYFVVVGITAVLGVLELIVLGMRMGWDSIFITGRVSPVLQLIGYTLIWFAYFHKSTRVKNTYGANL